MFHKTLLIVFFTIIILLASVWFFWYKPKFVLRDNKIYKTVIKKNSELFIKLQLKAKALDEFAAKNSFNIEVCFLIDMSIESGKNRFFVYDVKKNSIILSGLVAHGSCDNGFKTE